MKKLLKLTALCTAAAIGMSAAPVAAQSAEETITIGLDVTIALPDPVISGLEDVSLSWTEIPDIRSSVEDSQTFCLFTPTQFFSLTTTGANPSTGLFRLKDDSQTNPDLDELTYIVRIDDAFSGTDASLGTFQNGGTVTGIDSNLFNTDATCSDGENLSLAIRMSGSSFVRVGSQNIRNSEILAQVADGQTHNYTDQLTLLIEPEI